MEITFLLLFTVFVFIDAYDRIPHKMEVLVERFKFGDYYFVFYSKSANWAEAHTICQATRSRLAVVNTPERANFLADALSQTRTGFEDVWIGGQFSRDTWLWVPIGKTITPPIDNFPPWLNYPTKRGKNCLSLDRRNHREPIFVDLKCNLHRPFICEESVTGSIDKFPEGGGEIIINNRHYFLYYGRVTWQEALAFCKQSEAQLATIPNLDTATKLVELMKRSRPPFENVWIGAKRDYAGWMWVPTGQELANQTQKDGFPPWRFDFPSETMKSCVIMDHHPCLNPYHIHLIRLHRCEEPIFIEEMCDLKKDFLCEIAEDESSQELKPNLIVVDKITYIFYEEPLSWINAMFTCEKFNMTLAMPETARQWETIVSHMGELQRELYHVWLGGKWIPNKWVWLNNHSIPLPEANNTFPPWCLSMNLHEEDEDCINLDRDAHSTPLIYGYNCSMRQSFVCQLEGDDFIDTGDSNIKHEFEYHGNGLTYFEAEYECKLNHSHLAIVNNSKLAQKVALLLPRDTYVWIGARRMQGTWRWTKTREIIPDVADDTNYPPWENLASVLDKSVCLAMKSGYREQPFFVEKSCKEKLKYMCQFDQKELPEPDIILDVNDIKYYFYKQGVPWNEALAICNSGDLHLVNVGNLELASFLIEGMTDAVPIWTSGKQISKNSWSWITSGSKIPNAIKLGYPPWVGKTVPNDLEHSCLQLNNANGTPIFEAENCMQNRSFVCVNKIFVQNETELEIENMTISLQDIITNIEKAKKVCTDNGKNVVDITKLDYQNILKLMKSENVKSLWVDVIRDKDGKWVYSDTMKEFTTTIDFPNRNNHTITAPDSCLTLNLSPEEKLTLVPSLCSDFSRMICVSEVNKSTHIVPSRVEHIVNGTATIIAILENTIISHSSLVCNDLGGDMVGEELMPETIAFFKTLDPAYIRFWLDSTFNKNGVLKNSVGDSNNNTRHWLWRDGTPVLLKDLPDASEANANNIEKHCLVYDREEDKIIAVQCTEKYSTVCEKVERKCKPKIQNMNDVVWPEKCTVPVSGGTVCQAACPANRNLVGPQNHICSKGKWSYNLETKCDHDKSFGTRFDSLMKKTVKSLKSSFILFVLDYGVPKTVFQASLQFTKNLANTMLLNSNRLISIEMYSYSSKVTDLLENNNCYLIHTVDELEKKSDRSNSEPNYYGAFKTAEEEFQGKNASGVIFFFALRPDKGSMNKMEIINRLKKNGIVIVVISIGDDVNRNMLEDIASTNYGALQLYRYQSLKGLKDSSFFLKKKRKFTLSDCPRVAVNIYQ